MECPLACTLQSITVEALLMLFSSDISSPCVGHGGSGDGATYSNHVPSSVHVLACLRIPRGIRGCGRRSLRGGWMGRSTGLILGCHGRWRRQR